MQSIDTNRLKSTLYYCILFIAPVFMVVSYKNVANLVPLLFLLLLFISWKEFDPAVLKNPDTFLFALFLVFAFVSGLWSYHPGAALERIIKIVLLLIPALVLIANNHPAKYLRLKPAFSCVLVAFIIVAILIIWQLYGNFLIKNRILGKPDIDNVSANITPAIISLVILFWPLLALISKRFKSRNAMRLMTVMLTLILITVVHMGNSDTACLAAVLGAVAFFLVRFRMSLWIFKPVVIFSILFIFIFSPIIYDRLPVTDYKADIDHPLAQGITQNSYLHRIEIWDRCVELIADKPILGWGMAASLNLPKLDEPSKYIHGHTRTDFMYPHNIFIQCLLEYGIVGLTLFLAWLNALINRVSGTMLPERAYYAAALISVITVYSFGFPMWRSWWIVFLAIIPLIFMSLNHQEGTEN